jgi:hypothetical protein
MEQPFGTPDARNELGDYRHLFIPDTNDKRVDVVVLENRCPILGRRGTGKSALAQHLKWQVPRVFAAFVEVDLPPLFDHIVREVDRDPGKAHRVIDTIAQVWKVAIWTAVMERLVHDRILISPSVSTYLGAHQPSSTRSMVQLSLDGLGRLVRKEEGSLLDWSALNRALEERSYHKALQDTKECLALLGKCVVIIDSLDGIATKTDVTSDVMIGLLTAAKSESYKYLTVKCFLPTEAWIELRPRMPHVGQFEPFELRWSPDDLMRLLSSRVNRFLSERDLELARNTGEVTWQFAQDVRTKVWEKIFPEAAQAPHSPFLERTEDLIIRYTQLRPRQAIAICNGIANAAWPPMPDVPDEPRRRYSQVGKLKPHHVAIGIDEKLSGIVSEIVNAYSGSGDAAIKALDYFAGGEAIKTTESVSATEMAWTLAYRMGAIGPVRSIVKAAGNAAFNYYKAAEFEYCHRGPIDWRPLKDEQVAIHPIFHKMLGIQETGDTMIISRGFWFAQPLPIESNR